MRKVLTLQQLIFDWKLWLKVTWFSIDKCELMSLKKIFLSSLSTTINLDLLNPTENKLTLFWKKGENEYLIAASSLKKGVNEGEFRLWYKNVVKRHLCGNNIPVYTLFSL